MKPMDAGFWVDVLTEFILNAGTFLSGYTVANGQVLMPSKAALVSAAITGLIGAANHIRALRKVPSPTGVTA